MHTWVGTPSSPRPWATAVQAVSHTGCGREALWGGIGGRPASNRPGLAPMAPKVCALPERHQEQS